MNVGNYVNSARTLSLVIILLGYIGWDLGIHHSQRATIFTKARDLVTTNWIRSTYPDDETIVRKMIGDKVVVIDPATQQLKQSKPFTVSSSLGAMTINMGSTRRAERFSRKRASITGLTLNTLGNFDLRFTVNVKGPLGNWTVSKIKISDPTALGRLNEIASDLGVNSLDDPKSLLTAIEDKLYRRKVSVPSIDFTAFHSEQAVWVVTLLCFLGLVVLRSRIRLIGLDTDAGIDSPWLILDAQSIVEKCIATLWIAGILLSSWSACGALLFTEKDLMMEMKTPPVGRAATIFLFVCTLAVISGWASLASVCDLIKLRAIRAARRATIMETPENAEPTALANN